MNAIISAPLVRLVLALAANTIFLVSAGMALAQQVLQPADLTSNASDAENTPRRYAVEMIVFEYRDSNAGGTEVFLADELPVDGSLSQSLEFANEDSEFPGSSVREYSDTTNIAQSEDSLSEPDPSEISPAELVLNEIGSAQQIGLQILPSSNYSLDAIYEKLELLDAYKPILRTAWSQLTVAEDQSRALKLRRLGNPPIQLDGSVTLYLGRYLHLVLDLALEERSKVSRSLGGIPENEPGARRLQPGDQQAVDGRYNPGQTNPGLSNPGQSNPGQPDYEYQPDGIMRQGPVYFRIQEDRIVRSGELRYFDHPRFGVIAKITRVEENQAPGPAQP